MLCSWNATCWKAFFSSVRDQRKVPLIYYWLFVVVLRIQALKGLEHVSWNGTPEIGSRYSVGSKGASPIGQTDSVFEATTWNVFFWVQPRCPADTSCSLVPSFSGFFHFPQPCRRRALAFALAEFSFVVAYLAIPHLQNGTEFGNHGNVKAWSILFTYNIQPVNHSKFKT